MRRHLDTAIRMTILTAVLLGLLYPLAITGAAQVLFPGAAHGSLVRADGRVVGSAWIAQPFTQAKYFWPRPSAAGARGYDAMASAASNLGPTSRRLVDRVRADVRAQVSADPGLVAGSVPVDMVTTSGSGLDPDITVANARAQAARVAWARGMSLGAVLGLVREYTTGRTLGFIGEPRVNVLRLNLALDKFAPLAQAGQ
jgi:potassium-transporting ATPase KdpC subunit